MNALSQASDSAEQREAENVLRNLIVVELNCVLTAETVDLGSGIKMCVDGISRDSRILCEIYSRIGRLKAAQSKKVAADMLKLMLAESALRGSWRKIICLADTDAAKCFQVRTWLGAAAREFGFEICVINLPADVRAKLLEAQARQVMVNGHGA